MSAPGSERGVPSPAGSSPAGSLPYPREHIESVRRWLEEKLRAQRSISDVEAAAKGRNPSGFVVLDVRGRDAYAKAHVPGALCVPIDEIEALSTQLPRDRELATFCWNHT